MYTSIVNIRLENEKEGQDIELPTDVPFEELKNLIIEQWFNDISNLEISVTVQLFDGVNIQVEPSQTLAEAKVWDGSILTMHSNIPITPRSERIFGGWETT